MTSHSLPWFVTIAALCIAPLPLPYAYYELLKVGVCIACCYFALQSHKAENNTWMWIMIAAALVYNPINPLALGRIIWTPVNIATAILIWQHYRASAQKPSR